MYITKQWTIGMLFLAMTSVGVSANARSGSRSHRCHPHRVITVVARPHIKSHVSNRFTSKERLAIVAAYLKHHTHISVKQYAKMTRLSKALAEAELDAFAMDKKGIIRVVVSGNKKVYMKSSSV